MSDSDAAPAPHRAGVVALLGLPNAGKSTLLNRLLETKIAIVTRKAQTTRSRILGVSTEPGYQILWTDTPGIHRGKRPIDKMMGETAQEVADDCDIALLLVDLTKGIGDVHREWLAALAEKKKCVLLIGTHSDRPAAQGAIWPPEDLPEAWAAAFRISGVRGTGIDELKDFVATQLPEAPAYYGADFLTDRPLRWLAGESVREAAFEVLQQELPYAIAVAVREFDEKREGLVRIRAEILVERESQKRIVVGRGGEVIKRIGIAARKEIEALVGSQVHLELRVKIDPRWSKGEKRLKALGYH